MTATITSAQTKQFKRFVEDASDRALAEAMFDKESLQELLANGGQFQAHIREGIRKFSAKGSVIPVYLEIEVGGKTKDELLAELQVEGFFVSEWAKDIMSKPAWKPGNKEMVKFGRAKISDLGFTDPKKLPTTSEVWARIVELGHSLCESGDGPAIRLALKNQPRGDYFRVAMEQITDSDGNPDVFYLKHDDDGKRWLRTGWTGPDDGWDLDFEIVFRLRK
jgi:hypothetical protein